MAQEKEKKEITPSQYFEVLKGAKKQITTEALKKSYEAFIKLGEKYNKLGQVKSLQKLLFLADTLVKEEKLIEMGITTYVYKDTLEDYITTVADKTVKIIELAGYMREIPDELVDVIEKTRGIFDEFYVVFTDYTGKEERRVQKERRDKDPILFGVFKNRNTVSDRFYFLGDWVDEYCDLTLDKFIEQYQEKKGTDPTVTTTIPKTTEELVDVLKTYQIKENKEGGNKIDFVESTPLTVAHFKVEPSKDKEDKKPGFFDKVRSVFKK